MSSCFWQSESYANNVTKLANILVASYLLSYLPPGSCLPSSSSTSYLSPLTHDRTRRQVTTTILLIDTLLAVSCHHTRLVICPAVSDTFRAALTMSRSSPTYSSHLTHCRTHRQDPACHPAHRHHICHVLLAIILAASVRPPFSSLIPCSPYLHQEKKSASGRTGCVLHLGNTGRKLSYIVRARKTLPKYCSK